MPVVSGARRGVGFSQERGSPDPPQADLGLVLGAGLRPALRMAVVASAVAGLLGCRGWTAWHVMNPTARLLCDLIALPSVNPAFLPPGDTQAGEARLCAFLAATLGRARINSEQAQVAPGRPNLLARLTPVGRVLHRVVIAPHLDTEIGRASCRERV